MKINSKEVSKEVLAKAIACKTPKELVELAEENDIEMTKEEAEAYLSEIEDIELDTEQLKDAAGGFIDPLSMCPERWKY